MKIIADIIANKTGLKSKILQSAFKSDLTALNAHIENFHYQVQQRKEGSQLEKATIGAWFIIGFYQLLCPVIDKLPKKITNQTFTEISQTLISEVIKSNKYLPSENLLSIVNDIHEEYFKNMDSTP